MNEEKAWMHNWLDAISVNERLNGDAGTGYVGDSDENSLLYKDQNFDDSQDSSLDESDHEYDNYLYQMAGEFRRRTYNNEVIPSQPSVYVEKKPEMPAWFLDRPFQFHDRICLMLLPGLVIAFLLGGEMLMFIICLCGLVIFLLQMSEYLESSLTVYTASSVFITAFNCFTAFPLVWTSGYHFTLVIGLTIHTALTGAWWLLLFPRYRRDHPDTAVYIEYLLFTLYPVMAIVLVMWLSAMLSSIYTASYVVIACSFVVIQNFLLPTASSFVKSQRDKKDPAYILTTSESLLLSAFICALPCVIFVTGIVYKKEVLLSTWVEFIFVTSICAFIAMVTTSENLCLHYGLSQFSVQCGRALSVLTAVLTLPAALYNHGYHSPLLHFLPPILLVHAAFAYLVIQRRAQTQILIFITGGVVLATYTLCFISLPWTVTLYMSGGLDIRVLFFLVYICFVLSVQCVFAYILFDAVEFGLCLLVQTVVFSSTVKILEGGAFISSVPCIGVSVIAISVMYRLYECGKMPSQHMCLCGSFYATSAFTSVTTFLTDRVTSFSEYFLLLCLIFLLTSSEYEVANHMTTAKQVILKVVFTGVIALFNMPLWINTILLVILRREPAGIEYFCCVLLVEACLILRLSSRHKLARLRHFSLGLLFITAGLALVQPSLTLTWGSVVKWMVVSSFLLTVTLTQITRHLRKSRMLCAIFSAVIGLPLGISLSSLIFQNPEVEHNVFLSILSTILVFLSIIVWFQRSDLEQNSYKCLGVLMAELMACFCLQLTFGESLHLTAAVTMIALTTVAFTYKLHSLRRETLRLTREGNLQVSRLPQIGNVCTLAAFMTSFYFSPMSYWDWGFVASLLLFLLQEDHVVLKSPLRDNNFVPTVFTMTVTLILCTCGESCVWSSVDWSLTLSGVLEVSVTLLTLPVFVVLWTVLWNNHFYISDYYVAFVTPLFCTLLLTGSSLYAYSLSVVGLGAGYWLLTEKLPLTR